MREWRLAPLRLTLVAKDAALVLVAVPLVIALVKRRAAVKIPSHSV